MPRLELIFLHSASGDGFDAVRLLSMMRIDGRNTCARTAITDLSPPGIESEFYFVPADDPEMVVPGIRAGRRAGGDTPRIRREQASRNSLENLVNGE
jgi:hypothetical protein